MKHRSGSARIALDQVTAALFPLAVVSLLLGPAAGFAEASATTAAAAAAPAAPDHDWEVSIAPYLWLSDVVAEASFRDFSVRAEPHLKDLLSDLEFGFMGAFDLYHGPSRLFFNLDVFWMRLSSEVDEGPFQVGVGPFTFQTPGLQRQVGPFIIDTRHGPLVLGPFDVDTGPLRRDVPRVEFPVGPFDIENTMTQSAVRASFGYRLLDRPLASLLGHESKDDPRRLRADVYVGGRYWYVKARTEVESPPIEIPGFTIKRSLVAYPRLELRNVTVPGVTFGGADIDGEKSSWWIDPILGARVQADLCGRLGVLLNGNVGGFGIGSASRWSWEGLTLLTWRLGRHWTAAVGYRGLGVDRRSGDLEVDLIMHGPVLGIIYRFP